MLFGGYFACAALAVASVLVAAKSGPNTLAGWVYGVCAVLSGLMSMICLMREDTITIAATVGEDWLVRINRTAAQSRRARP